MSYRGTVDVKCPGGCESFTAEIWSVIRADRDAELRESVLSGELNLLVCPHCERVFYSEQPLVYHDPPREFLAFIYPEPYLAQEALWRSRMEEDYRKLQAALPGTEKLGYAPVIFFGLASLQVSLQREEEFLEECQVAQAVALGLGLTVYAVSPAYARDRDIPEILPLASGTSLRERVLEGLQRLVGANDRLTRYGRFLGELMKPGAAWQDPPTRKGTGNREEG